MQQIIVRFVEANFYGKGVRRKIARLFVRALMYKFVYFRHSVAHLIYPEMDEND